MPLEPLNTPQYKQFQQCAHSSVSSGKAADASCVIEQPVRTQLDFWPVFSSIGRKKGPTKTKKNSGSANEHLCVHSAVTILAAQQDDAALSPTEIITTIIIILGRQGAAGGR